MPIFNINDCEILPGDPYGRWGEIIIGQDEMNYEFGSISAGYQIKVYGRPRKGQLTFLRDGSCWATTGAWLNKKVYEMSHRGIANRKPWVSRLDEEGNIELFDGFDDPVALALFVINHHKWNRTGVFSIVDKVKRDAEALERAAAAFREKDYRKVVAELEPMRELLTPSEVKKLEYAQEKVEEDGV